MIFRLLKPALFALDSETGHRLAINGLKALPLRGPMPVPGALGIRLAGLDFPNPVGVAAGFDKDAEVPAALLGLGLGFTEVGSITPLPQAGNPKPRLFRLVEDAAVINRMGFNNSGGEVALARLKARAGRPRWAAMENGPSTPRRSRWRTRSSRRRIPKSPVPAASSTNCARSPTISTSRRSSARGRRSARSC